jgi:hypothetical protein
MSGEIEAAGAAATAGLVATAIDEPKSRRKRGQGACANCGADLSGKRYCAECGQPAHLHHALFNMLEEFVRGLVFFDARIWRTLGLLVFRPGTLTYNYIHGKRARYISPIALFLLAVFAMFFVFSLIGGSRLGVSDEGTQAQGMAASVEEQERRLATLEEELNEAKSRNASAKDLQAAEIKVDVQRKVVEGLRAGAEAAAQAQSDGPPTDDAVEIDGVEFVDQNDVYAEVREAAEKGELDVNTGFPALDANLKANLLNPELAVYKIQNAAYKFAFLLVPISLPLVWLMFMWRRGTTLFDHTVYILYSLSFVSLLFIICSLLTFMPDALAWLAAPLVLAGPVHAFFHLKGGYGLGWFSAIWRLPFQLIFSLVGLVLFLIVIFVLGLVG